MLDTPERRRTIIDMLWELAVWKCEGPESQGAPVNPEEVWSTFKGQLADVGLELTVTASDGSETVIDRTALDELLEEARVPGAR
jgi:hypothetical protein